MTGIAYPDCSILVSSVDPNDPNTVDWWTDLAIRTWRVNQAGRGRQYELDQNLSGRFSCDWRNVDEYLNPANASSPLLALAKPMRRLRWMGSYPPAGTGNLINSTAGMDPTVDSYTVGTLPAWLAPVGGTGPTVQNANPRSGANSLQYTVAATSTQQGATTIPLPLRPGQQYTASWWVRQTTASTQQIAVQGMVALDRFQRTTASGVGTAESGQAWTTNGGTAGDYSTTPGPNPPGIGTMSISNSTVNVTRRAILPLGAQDFDYRILVTIPAVATGAAIVVGCEGRYADANNHYRIELDANTNGTLDLLVRKNVAGTLTTLATTTAVLPYSAGTQVWIRAQGAGTTIQGKVWQAGATEPSAWTTTATDASLTAAGSIAILNQLTTGNTNGTTVLAHTRLAVTNYSVPGTSATATATYTQLSVTFTATATTHAVQVATVGTALAGTVNLDDIMLAPGTLTTFQSTGPLIRGLWGGQLGELPATWVPGSAGFEGAVAAVANGPLGVLQSINVHTDLVTSVLRKTPDYYWPMWDGSGTTAFAEISGNNGPPLQPWVSQAGPATTPNTVGAAAPWVGDPGGAAISAPTPTQGTGSSDPGTMYGTGPIFNRTPAVSFPKTATGGSWGATMMICISKPTYPGVSVSEFALKPATFAPTNAAQISPGCIGLNDDGSIFLNMFGTVSTGGALAVTVSGLTSDGNPHIIVATVNQVAGGNTTGMIWVDGVLQSNSFQTTAFMGLMTAPVVNVDVGGRADGISTVQMVGGTYGHVALWSRVLSNAEITDLANAFKGNLGETSGTRAGRYLTNYFVGATVVDTASMSKMGAPSANEGTTLLAALQRIQDTEAGNLFENRDGALQFDGREIRYLRTTPTVVFGDGPGEIPYSGDAPPIFGYDLQQVNNQAVITRTNGIRAVAATDTTGSINTNYAHGYTLTVDCQTDLEAIDHANWVVANRQQPKQRAKTITIDVGSNPALFPTVMNLEIGTRATINRRPKAANSGAGITMSADYFVENIQHRQVDPELGTWLVDLQLSPVPLQPWLLGDATYGQLGITTIPGF